LLKDQVFTILQIMGIDYLANFYVDILEPGFKLTAFGVLLVVVLHGLNLIKHGGSGTTFVGTSYRYLVKWVVLLVGYGKQGVSFILKCVTIYFVACVGTIKEFLSAKS
jgi:hypothetical protein